MLQRDRGMQYTDSAKNLLFACIFMDNMKGNTKCAIKQLSLVTCR